MTKGNGGARRSLHSPLRDALQDCFAVMDPPTMFHVFSCYRESPLDLAIFSGHSDAVIAAVEVRFIVSSHRLMLTE